MQRTTYTAQQKADALAIVADKGITEAARVLGIPMGTVAAWAHRNGVQSPTIEEMVKVTEASRLTVAQRKAALAETLLDHAVRIAGQLDEPTVEKVVKVVAMGHNAGSATEIVEVEYDRPPTADQKRIAETVGVLVAQVQLLTGEATSRTEMTVDGVKERALATVHELTSRVA